MMIKKSKSCSLILIFTIWICCFILEIEAADSQLHLVKVTDADALCLDGSPAAYYISKEGDPKKIYLEFEGGGWCTGVNSMSQTIESCYQRSKGDLGSSKSYPEIISIANGALSINTENNFKDWTRVILKYCDGTGHQGTRKNPILYKGINLYIRGHNVTVGQLNILQKNNKIFSQATEVVVGGDSAGGLAVFLWTNYIKQRVKVGKVWALPDSGIFLDSLNVATNRYDYRSMFKNLVALANNEIYSPVSQCTQKYPHQLQNCMFAENLAPYIKTPIFIIQSLYDTWSIYNILGIKCIQGGSLIKCSDSERIVIEEYHRNTTTAIFGMAANNLNGFFAPACAVHVFGFSAIYYSDQWRIPQGSIYSISKSVDDWLKNNTDSNTYRRIDLGKWPDNKPCAGLTNLQINLQTN